MNIKHIHRRARVAALFAVSVLIAGALAGTAWAGTSGWQDIWNQIKPLLSDPGTINNSDNPVHWTKLKGVPAGLADGLDNGVDRAGFGLTKNLYPNLEFVVDTTKIQRRVSGTCPAGQTVRAIAVDGTVTCSVGTPTVYEGWNIGSGTFGGSPIGNDWSTVGGALDLPSGTWSIVTKTDLGGSHLYVDCRLEAWVDGSPSSKLDTLHLSDWGDGSETNAVLTGVFDSSAPFRTAVVCRDFDHEVLWFNIKITATKVGELHTQQLH